VRIYLIELRRSPLRWWLPPLVAIDLVVMFFGRGRGWIGVWPEASVAAQFPAFYFGPLFAAVAAAGRSERKSFDEDRTPQARARWIGESLHFAATLTFGLVPIAVGAAAAYAVSVGSAGPGGIWYGYLLVGVALIVSCAAVGHLAGRLSPSSVVTPIIAGLVCFVAIVALGQSDGLLVLTGYPNLEPSSAAVTLHLVVASVLVAVAIVVPQQRGQRFGPRWAPLAITGVGLATLVGCAVLVDQAGPVQVLRRPTNNMRCSDGAHVFCVWPEHHRFLGVFQQMTDRLDAVPTALVQANPISYELGLRGPEHDLEDFSLLEGQPWQAAFGVAVQNIGKSFETLCTAASPELSDKRSEMIWELVTWLAVRIYGDGQPSALQGGSGVDMNEMIALTRQPEEVQAKWFSARKDAVDQTPCG
jgi:hypothetical protein